MGTQDDCDGQCGFQHSDQIPLLPSEKANLILFILKLIYSRSARAKTIILMSAFACSTIVYSEGRPPVESWSHSYTGPAGIGPLPTGGFSTAQESCMVGVATNTNAPGSVFTVLTPVNDGVSDAVNCGCQFYDQYGVSHVLSMCVQAVRAYFCSSGYRQNGNTCVNVAADPDKNKGCHSCAEGNPINATVGNKLQIETDFQGQGPFPLLWSRIYNSFGRAPGILRDSAISVRDGMTWTPFDRGTNLKAFQTTNVGVDSNSPIDYGWRHSYDRSIKTTSSSIQTTAYVFRSDSRTRTFTLENGIFVPDSSDAITKLTQITINGQISEWQFINENDEAERYDASGKLISITNRAGLTQTLQYNAQNFLSSVTDYAGRKLLLTYDGIGHISSMTNPSGDIYIYIYDGNGNLSTVTYPGGHTRQYVYENSTFTHSMTGIMDENGIRFSTYFYDSANHAISTEHAVGIDKVTLSYPSAITTRATDAVGATRTYSTKVINGVAKAGSISETGVNINRTRSMTYDTNGNVASRTDFNGAVTTYTYDLTRNLETIRVEASGTANARTITTTWHSSYRQPLVIAEPLRRTSYTYDSNGNQLSKTIQATSDTTGVQGVSGAAVGAPRTWSNSYNNFGQVLTTIGPRIDIVDLTSYAYDTMGNLIGITNALNQITTLSNYDLNGRVGRITDSNGTVTDMSYSPRGWLTSKSIIAGSSTETTNYSYDGVGQLTNVTLPDASSISYTYDPAHRLTNISDSAGNSIVYTLDAMGNRINEQVKDPSGQLTRQTTRVVDALNRVQQITGGIQ